VNFSKFYQFFLKRKKISTKEEIKNTNTPTDRATIDAGPVEMEIIPQSYPQLSQIYADHKVKAIEEPINIPRNFLISCGILKFE